MKNKNLVVLLVLAIYCMISSVCFAADPEFYDGVENKLGTCTKSYFFANGTPITVEPSGDGVVVKWGESSYQEILSTTRIFGGSHNDETEMETSITVKNGAVVNCIVGGGLHKSHVTKSTIVIESGATCYQVQGGGAAAFTNECGCDYKSGNAANPAESLCIVDEANVTVKDGAIFTGEPFGQTYSLLYGGGQGNGCTNVANLVIEGGTFEDTYVTAGGANGYTGEANMTISGGTFAGPVQGINRGSMDTISMEITGGTFETVYIGGIPVANTGTYSSAEASISGENITINSLLPGSNGTGTEENADSLTVELGEGVLPNNISNPVDAESLFGGNLEAEELEGMPYYYDGETNKLGTDTNPYFFANGAEITIEAATDGALITWGEGNSQVVPSTTTVFGGAHNDATEMETSIIVKGGVLEAIFGGGLHISHVTKSNIVVESTATPSRVYGGGADQWTHKCGCENSSFAGESSESTTIVEEANILVKEGATFDGSLVGSSYSLLVGGGLGYNRVDVANVTIEGGSFEDTYVIAGGVNGYTGEANLVIKGGTFENVVQGINRGTIDTINMDITGGTFNNLYVGGDLEDATVDGSYESADITISGTSVTVNNFLPGSNGAEKVDDATKITGKIGRVTTTSNITDKATALEIFGSNVTFLAYTSSSSGGSSTSKYTITVVCGENGTVSPDGKVRVKKGEDQEFTFEAAEGYEIDKILVDGEEVEATDSYIFENVKKAHKLEVTFKVIVSDWAESEIESAKANGLMPEALVNKDLTKQISRLEFASACVKLYEKLTGEVATVGNVVAFNDCADTEVLKAYNLGITNGMNDNNFAPDMVITREQMATMLARTIAKTGIDTTVKTKDIKFADEMEVSDWALNSVRYMAETGLINGMGEGKFEPKGTATREQTLAISQRTFTAYEK